MISFNGNHVCFVVIYAVAEQVIIPLLGANEPISTSLILCSYFLRFSFSNLRYNEATGVARSSWIKHSVYKFPRRKTSNFVSHVIHPGVRPG